MTRWRPLAISAADSGKTHFALQNGSEIRRKAELNQAVDYDFGGAADSGNSALQIAFGSRPAADFADAVERHFLARNTRSIIDIIA